jgi:hypothetical protein
VPDITTIPRGCCTQCIGVLTDTPARGQLIAARLCVESASTAYPSLPQDHAPAVVVGSKGSDKMLGDHDGAQLVAEEMLAQSLSGKRAGPRSSRFQ